jgi:Sec7-like guanine-nucleotide exchange factor
VQSEDEVKAKMTPEQLIDNLEGISDGRALTYPEGG